jgi:hypothetical protein
MLKLTYTDMGLHLERVADSLAKVATRRAMLALRTGQAIYLEPSFASVELPAQLSQLADLRAILTQDNPDAIALCTVDDNWVEINFRGYWLASSPNADEGIFLVELGKAIEVALENLWQQAKVDLPLLS